MAGTTGISAIIAPTAASWRTPASTRPPSETDQSDLSQVEHDRYVVVAGTTGISAIIAPDGRELANTGFNQAAYLDIPVHLETRLTPASRWDPVVQWLLVGTSVAAIIATVLQDGRLARGYRRHRPPRSRHT